MYVHDQAKAMAFHTEVLGLGGPFTSFERADVRGKFDRLSTPGDRFNRPSTQVGAVLTAVLDDTRGCAS